jgi:hypothetical protein
MVVGGAAAIYVGISMLADGVAKRKTEAESQLSSDRSTLVTLETQVNKSGEAEKRYVAIELLRGNSDYTSSMEALIVWLRDAGDRYRFTKMTTGSNPPNSATDKPELAGFTTDFDIRTRTRVKLDFEAVSDMHVFSFFDELAQSAPGLIRIDSLQIKRKDERDLTDAMINQIRSSGGYPILIEVKSEITLITVKPKEVSATNPGSAAPAPGGAPAPVPIATPGAP